MNEEYQEISLIELWHVVVKKWWLIVSMTLVFAIVAGVYSVYFITPMYETHTTMVLGKQTDYSEESIITTADITLNQKLIGTYGEIAKSNIVLNDVIGLMDLNIGTEDLRKKISVNLLNNSEIIKITVTDANPKLATDIANEMSDVFMARVASLMQIENVQIVDKAEVPTNPVSPRKTRNVAIAGVLGMMLSLFIIFVIEMVDNRIKDTKYVQEVLGLRVLGTLPSER